MQFIILTSFYKSIPHNSTIILVTVQFSGEDDGTCIINGDSSGNMGIDKGEDDLEFLLIT